MCVLAHVHVYTCTCTCIHTCTCNNNKINLINSNQTGCGLIEVGHGASTCSSHSILITERF